MNFKYNLRWSKKKLHIPQCHYLLKKNEAVSEKVSASVGIKRVIYSQVLLLRSIWLTGHHQVWMRIITAMLPVCWSGGFEENTSAIS